MTREEHLEKTLRNIVALGTRYSSTPAARLNRILDVAENALAEQPGGRNTGLENEKGPGSLERSRSLHTTE